MKKFGETLANILRMLIVPAIIVALALVIKHYVVDSGKAIDVTDLAKASPEKVQSTLGMDMQSASSMASRVFQYSKSGEITAIGNEGYGVAVVYHNGNQLGLRIENPDYEMYNIRVGKSRVGIKSATTFKYDDLFEINEGVEKEILGKEKDFPMFFCNWSTNECLVVSCEKTTGNVMSITYMNDAKKVTERLGR